MDEKFMHSTSSASFPIVERNEHCGKEKNLCLCWESNPVRPSIHPSIHPYRSL